MTPLARLIFVAALSSAAAAPALAQISFSTAVDLALKNNPKVRMAQADIDKAQAEHSQLRDAFIPNIVVGSDIGYSYGFPIGQPSIVNVTSNSIVYSFSQRDDLRASKSAIDAAVFALRDARQSVVEDTSVTYLTVDRDLKRQAALEEQQRYADRLVVIVQQRLDAGQDTPIDLTTAKLTDAQIHLTRLRAEDETVADQAHLARLIGLPSENITTTPASVPQIATPAPEKPDSPLVLSPAVQSAYATARAKRETAFGDHRYLYYPQLSFFAEYSRYAEFNNYQDYYLHFQHNNAGIGVQIAVPILDYLHRAKAREADADAAHAEHEADMLRDQFFDSRVRARHTADELSVRAEIATLDQQLAQQQLDVILVQIKNGTGNPNAPQMSPKDEQTSRIAERDKYISVINADLDLATAQISLMRQTGQLDSWAATSTNAPSDVPAAPTPAPSATVEHE